MSSKEKEFDAVKWVREIRDKFYQEHKHLNGEQYIKAIRDEARKSKFWTEKNEREIRRLQDKANVTP